MTERLSDSILRAGLDDWVPLAAIEGWARQFGIDGDAELLNVSLAAIRALAEERLVLLGEVSDGGFFEWNEPLDRSLARVRRAWPLGTHERGFACWLKNTSLGDDRARAVPSGP
jgi:hypothetical protein